MTKKEKHPHGYLPKIQYHSATVLEKTHNLMQPNLPESIQEAEWATLNKSLDSIIYFTTKLREQYES